MKNIDLIIRRIKNESMIKLIFGILVLVCTSLYFLKGYSEEFLGVISIAIIVFWLIVALILCFDGVLGMLKPLRKYPYLKEMADKIDASVGPKYQNKYIYYRKYIGKQSKDIYDDIC
ncbi:MAG: hypothetical protein IJT72_10135 [Lachnospiraceae bacterium]|nr:hypothetical protein [Lachnospiraceae bacterium]